MSAAFNSRGPRTVKPISKEQAGELIKKMRGERACLDDYREKSLKMNGLILFYAPLEWNLPNSYRELNGIFWRA